MRLILDFNSLDQELDYNDVANLFNIITIFLQYDSP